MESTPPKPVLLLAYSEAEDEDLVGRREIEDELFLGRKAPVDMTIPESRLSKVGA